MPDTSVELSGVRLKNPVVGASGAFGYGAEAAEYYDLNVLGSLSFKGTTAETREGNPAPRIAECPAGMLNAVGLQNPGIDRVVSEELPRLAELFAGPVIANVSGFSIEEYAMLCERLDEVPQVALIELNISCPNVRGGGMAFGVSPEGAAAATRAARRATRKPLYVKLSPNVTDIADIARASVDEGADGLTAVNTLLGMRIDIRRRRPVLANVTGGLSGPAVFPVALRCVWEVSRACRVPVMGCGGVASAADVVEMMMAGASAVQVGAAALADPCAPRDIALALPAEMERLGIGRLADIVGAAWK